MQPLRELATPLLDMSGPIPFTALQAAFAPFFPKGRFYYVCDGRFVDFHQRQIPAGASTRTRDAAYRTRRRGSRLASGSGHREREMQA